MDIKQSPAERERERETDRERETERGRDGIQTSGDTRRQEQNTLMAMILIIYCLLRWGRSAWGWMESGNPPVGDTLI